MAVARVGKHLTLGGRGESRLGQKQRDHTQAEQPSEGALWQPHRAEVPTWAIRHA